MSDIKENRDIEISVVIPLYDEEENLKPLYNRLTEVLGKLHKEYEIIFVDDGSKDKTFAILKEINQKDKQVKIIKFSKNFGQLYALITGIKMTKGNVIITMDGDLQNIPEDIPKFLTKIEEGFDLVSGWRYKRKDSLVRKFLSLVANLIIQKKTGIKLHDYGCAFMAMQKDLASLIENYGENARFVKPLLVRLAKHIGEIKIEHSQRNSGISKYNLFRIIVKGMDFIWNFKPTIISKGTLPYVISFTVDL